MFRLQGEVDAVIKAMREQAQDLSGRLSLGGLAGLFSRCRILISNDSGPLHLGGAVGTGTVGIYWCFNLVNAGPMTRLHHRPFVSWQMTCPICGMNYSQAACEHRTSLVAGIAPKEVISAALDLLLVNNSAYR